jgi:hypothetical protein
MVVATVRESKTRKNLTSLFTEDQLNNLQELVQCETNLRQLKEMIKEEEDRKRDLEDKVMAEMHEYPTNPPWNVGGMTVYLKRDVRLTTDAERRPDLIHALDRNGLENLLKRDVNLNVLSAWYRNQLEAEEEVPQEVLDSCDVIEQFRIQFRKA